VVLAANQQQNQILRELAKRGKANGLQGLQFLSNSELRQREPMVQATEESIAYYKGVMKKLVALIEERACKVHF
jgi:L-2-hydroxyglutarate oxidase LhgO